MDFYKEEGYTLLNLREAGPRGKLPSETKARISRAHLGKTHSFETRRKISLKKRGVKLSKKHRTNIGKGVLGNKQSPETRKKIREAQLGEKGNNFKGYVLVYRDNEFIGRYAGCNEAAHQLAISKRSVLLSINKQRPTKYGYIFIREPQKQV